MLFCGVLIEPALTYFDQVSSNRYIYFIKIIYTFSVAHFHDVFHFC
jgi:hypothetical protein